VKKKLVLYEKPAAEVEKSVAEKVSDERPIKEEPIDEIPVEMKEVPVYKKRKSSDSRKD